MCVRERERRQDKDRDKERTGRKDVSRRIFNEPLSRQTDVYRQTENRFGT